MNKGGGHIHKSIKPIISVVIMGVVALYSISSVQASGVNEYTTNKETTQSTQSKDLSEFGSRLSKRLGEVFQELVGLITNSLKEKNLQEERGLSFQDQLVKESDFKILEEETQKVKASFEDIETIPERYFVDVLAQQGIVKGKDGKFFPDNYARVGDFIKILVDAYRMKVGYDITTDAGMSYKKYFLEKEVPVSLEKYLNTAYELGFLDNVLVAKTAKKQDIDSFLTTKIIDQIFTNIETGFPGLITKPKMEISDLLVKRGIMAKYIVQAFQLMPIKKEFIATSTKNYFTDIEFHPYKDSIKTLADLGIVNSKFKKFYPDNYLRKYEFVVMLVNALAVVAQKKFNPEWYQGSDSLFADVSPKESYAPRIRYAQEKNLISSLTTTKGGKKFFNPNEFMTKRQVYQLLEDVAGMQMYYDEAHSAQSKMTRGEFAFLLVQTFNINSSMMINTKKENQTEIIFEEKKSNPTDNLSLLMQIKALLAKM